MILKQKDLVLIPFPFSDVPIKKVRPALIVSNDSFNKKSLDYILVPITSVIKNVPYSLMLTQNDLSEGKLICDSRIRIDKFFSIEKNQVLNKIGSINDELFVKVRSLINEVF